MIVETLAEKLFSLSIWGNFSNVHVFQRKGAIIFRYPYRYNPNPNTPGRWNWRKRFSAQSKFWNRLTEEQKKKWEAEILKHAETGRAHFSRVHILSAYPHREPAIRMPNGKLKATVEFRLNLGKLNKTPLGINENYEFDKDW